MVFNEKHFRTYFIDDPLHNQWYHWLINNLNINSIEENFIYWQKSNVTFLGYKNWCSLFTKKSVPSPLRNKY
jgi:hypothetical protein